jgi:hypothetical protein
MPSLVPALDVLAGEAPGDDVDLSEFFVKIHRSFALAFPEMCVT